MPELPEVEALAHHLREHALYRPVARVDVASMSALKTFDPPVSALVGRVVTGAARYGKFLAVEFPDRPDDPLHLITHLSRAGLAALARHGVRDPAEARASGPLELRRAPRRGRRARASTSPRRARRSAWPCTSSPTRSRCPGIARLGPDALALSARRVRRAARRAHRADQDPDRRPADDRRASATPTATRSCTPRGCRPTPSAGRLKPEQVDDLHAALRAVLTDAVERSVGQGAATLKGEKRSGLRVHARTGLPCPVCGDTVREVSFADRSFQYCPGCQTGGKPLADRRLSRLVR